MQKIVITIDDSSSFTKIMTLVFLVVIIALAVAILLNQIKTDYSGVFDKYQKRSYDNLQLDF